MLATIAIAMATPWSAIAQEVTLAGGGPALPTGQAAATDDGGGAEAAVATTTGQFTTSVAFKVPAFHGLEPTLGLAYASDAGGTSVAGTGWRLTGGSAITRGSVGGGAARFDANDRFYLDGDELISCAAVDSAHVPGCPASAGPLAYFATRTDRGQRIVGVGGIWRVWGQDGVRRDYERKVLFTGDQRYDEPSQWLLSAVTDRHGNQIRYEYQRAAGRLFDIEEPLLRSISYGPYQIVLTYGDGGYASAFAVGAGDRSSLAQRLETVEVRHDGATIRGYGMTYTTSPVTGRPLLATVRQYGNDPSVAGAVTSASSLPPMTFGYDSQDAPAATAPTVSTMYLAEGLGSGESARRVAALPGVVVYSHLSLAVPDHGGRVAASISHLSLDLDGDGRMDHVVLSAPYREPVEHDEGEEAPPPDRSLRAERYLAQADGTYRFERSDAVPEHSLLGDLDGDGRVEFFPDPLPRYSGWRATVGDLNGDRCADVVAVDEDPARSQHEVRLGDCRGDFGAGLPLGVSDLGDQQLFADVNGDGRDDVIAVSGRPISYLWGFLPRPRRVCAVMSNAPTRLPPLSPWLPPFGFSSACTTIPSTSLPDGIGWADIAWHTGDVNGDGFADVVATTRGGIIAAQVSRGDGTFTPQLAYDASIGGVGDVGVRVVDFDRDGRADVVGLAYPIADESHHLKYTLRVHRSTGVVGQSYVEFAPARIYASGQIPYFGNVDPLVIGYGLAMANQSADYVDHDGDGSTDVVVWAAEYRAQGRESAHDPRPLRCGPWDPAAAWDSMPPECSVPPVPRCNNNDPALPACLHAEVTLRPYVVFTGELEPTASDWLRGDLDGDRRTDLARLSNRGPGVLRVETRTRTEAGAYIDQTLELAVTGGRLPTAAFRPAELDGDGRLDFVAVDSVPGDATQVRVWMVRSQPTAGLAWTVSAHDATIAPAAPVSGWRVMDANADGRDDLVNVQVDQAAHLVRTSTLLATDTGFAPAVTGVNSLLIDVTRVDDITRQVIHTAEDLGPVQADGLQELDVNGDGATDLAGVFGRPESTQPFSFSLVSARDGTFNAVGSITEIGATDVATPSAWRAVELDGDGYTDLARVTLRHPRQPWFETPSYEVVVDGMLSRGDGRFRALPLMRVAHPKPTTLAAWRFADINGDRRADLVRLGFIGDDGQGHLEVTRYLGVSHGDGGPEVELVPQPTEWAMGGLPLPQLEQVALEDVDGDDDLDAEFMTYAPAGIWDLRTYTTHFDRASDRLVRIGNPAGATQTMRYGVTNRVATTLNDPSRGCQLGGAATVLLGVTVAPGAGSPATESTTEYDCPLYVASERTFMGWQQVTERSPAVANQAQTTAVTTYQSDPACGATAVRRQTSSTSGQVSTTEWHHTVAHASPPFRCQLDRTETTTSDALGDSISTATAYEYDGYGRRVVTRDLRELNVVGDGTVSETAYVTDPGTFVTAVTAETVRDEQGAQLSHVAFDLDDRGQVAAAHVWNRGRTGVETITTTFGYDGFGNQIWITDPEGSTSQVAYDASGLLVESTTNALGHTTQTTWDVAAQQPLVTTDPNGGQVTRQYDAFGRVAVLTNDRGGEVSYQYYVGSYGTVAVTNAAGVWSQTTSDGLGRPYLRYRPGTSGYEVQVTTYSDASQRPAAVGAWQDPGEPTQYTQYRYDQPGGISTEIHPDGASTSVQQGVVWTVSTDESGHQTRTRSNLAGAVVEVLEAHDGGWASTRHEYDTFGRLVKSIDPAGNERRLVLDSLGRVEQEVDADLGTTTTTYDRVGNVLTQTDARGVTVTATYDALHRPVTRENSLNDRFLTFQYDETNGGAGLGRLTSVLDSDAGCAVAARFQYDTAGNQTHATQCWDGRSATVERGFDGLGRPTWSRLPTDAPVSAGMVETVSLSYDAAGRPQGLSGYVSNATYDSRGRITRLELANGTYETSTFSLERGWLTRLEAGGPAGPLFIETATHRTDGVVIASQRSAFLSTGRRDVALTYTYDDQHRLTAVGGDRVEAFSYDHIGNLTSTDDLGAYTYPAALAPRPHAALTAGPKAFTYDEAGNLITETEGGATMRTLVWNESGLPARVTVTQPDGSTREVAYAYGFDGRRVRVSSATQTRLTLLPEVELEVVDADGPGPGPAIETRVQQYGFAGRVVARRTSSATAPDEVRFLHRDALGSSVVATDALGAAIAGSDVDYTAYGRELGDSHGAGDHGFTGQRQDDATAVEAGVGLVYMNARYYDPKTARFISPDTMVPGAGLYGLNRYAYVSGNPISFIDPTGHFQCNNGTTAPDESSCKTGGSADGGLPAQQDDSEVPDPNKTPNQALIARGRELQRIQDDLLSEDRKKRIDAMIAFAMMTNTNPESATSKVYSFAAGAPEKFDQAAFALGGAMSFGVFSPHLFISSNVAVSDWPGVMGSLVLSGFGGTEWIAIMHGGRPSADFDEMAQKLLAAGYANQPRTLYWMSCYAARTGQRLADLSPGSQVITHPNDRDETLIRNWGSIRSVDRLSNGAIYWSREIPGGGRSPRHGFGFLQRD